jgi:hypothetical protein
MGELDNLYSIFYGLIKLMYSCVGRYGFYTLSLSNQIKSSIKFIYGFFSSYSFFNWGGIVLILFFDLSELETVTGFLMLNFSHYNWLDSKWSLDFDFFFILFKNNHLSLIFIDHK